jgi:hypothetical protein
MAKKHNAKLGLALLLIPLIVGGFSLYYVFGGTVAAQLGFTANNRLLTSNWQEAQNELASTQPTYEQKYSEYKIQPGQSIEWAAEHFSVNLDTLRQMNPGSVVPGTTIKVPAVQAPLAPLPATGHNLANIVIKQEEGVLYVSNDFRNPKVTMTIPELMQVLQAYNAIEQRAGTKDFVLNTPLFLQDNIRLDITADTVHTLYLKSGPNFDITTLTFKDAEALISGVTITSLDPTNGGKPDLKYQDGRSFVRAYSNTRMDVVSSHILDLGMALEQMDDPVGKNMSFIPLGGIYGISWRIPTHTYGENIATGWVENSTMDHNYIGAYTFGASGMMWRGNVFDNNTLYGLDPHDDSNNAMVENNLFAHNGKHGFIVSKRCNFNIIRNNVSIDNHLHGYMLHQDSNYNVIENNVSIGNVDNFVIFNSHYNTIRGNKSYNPTGSHVRINSDAKQTFVQNNMFYGGPKGVYVYDHASGVLIENNTFDRVTHLLFTENATRILFANNTSEKVGYHLGNNDHTVFGPNTISGKPAIDMKPLNTTYKY